MKKEKNVDDYYNKLLQYRNEFNSRNSLKEITRNGKEVKTLLENIMDIHKDYLLTNGFLAFIVCRSLDGRNYPDNELFRERVKYYLNLVSTLDDEQLMVFLKRNYFYRTFSTPVSYYLTPNERLLVKIYRNAFKEIDKMKIPWGTNNYFVACEVLSSYGAIALYNQTFDNQTFDNFKKMTIFYSREQPVQAFSALMAFRTARTVTPTSAKTASHMVASPTTASSRTATFTPMAKAMF